ncbi:unnamed protein product [Enterobius vermicularis]|uniref:RBR-type E3 ubiquitin transferase n=1 Tax=Enterobius vermicularis TaxID=51028 RepID=A0A0N4VLD1_ENTVE|nr:unnamed protein product [Enterobius vermicularis]
MSFGFLGLVTLGLHSSDMKLSFFTSTNTGWFSVICRNDVKRRLRLESGPPLVRKYLYIEDSDEVVPIYIDDASGEVIRNRGMCLSSLVFEDSFGIESSTVAYSENKKGRWRLISALCDNIRSLQDPDSGVRVSLALYIRNGSTTSERGVDSVHLNDSIGFNNFRKIRELHTVLNREEVHKFTKLSSYKSFTSEPNPLKRKRKKQKNSLHIGKYEKPDNNISNVKKKNVPSWKRKTQMIYYEQVDGLSKSLVEMNNKLPRSRKKTRELKHSFKTVMEDVDKYEEEFFGFESSAETVFCSSSHASSDLIPYSCVIKRKINGCEVPAGDCEVKTLEVRQCLRCREYCQRDGGCNHMTCACGKEFCYKCSQEWGESF